MRLCDLVFINIFKFFVRDNACSDNVLTYLLAITKLNQVACGL